MFAFNTLDLKAISELPLDLIEEINARIDAENKIREEERKEMERKSKTRRPRKR